MTSEIVERVRRSARYRDVDDAMLERLATEELPRSRNADDAAKRVKRRLHQAVGAFRGQLDATGIFDAWHGDLADPGFRVACADALLGHASTRERVPHLDTFYTNVWRHTGVPDRVLDIGCGLAPLALAWMEIGDATYLASDVDRRPLAVVQAFLNLVGQPHEVRALDAVAEVPADEADVALLLKLITTLDRQDPHAAPRLVDGLRVRHAVVSFPVRSLGGRGKGMDRTYRERLEQVVGGSTRVSAIEEVSVPNELVFVLTLEPHG